jgi:predicted flavoprotein YhiN
VTRHAPAVAIVGAGPAGLMAAEVLSAAGVNVHVYDAMPSVGRKFLLAGLGGLNLTHAEPFEAFASRYGARTAQCTPWLQTFGPQAVRDWAQGLGIDTFVGTSQRAFVTRLAAPLAPSDGGHTRELSHAPPMEWAVAAPCPPIHT